MIWKENCDLSASRSEEILWRSETPVLWKVRCDGKNHSLSNISFVMIPKALKERMHDFVVWYHNYWGGQRSPQGGGFCCASMNKMDSFGLFTFILHNSQQCWRDLLHRLGKEPCAMMCKISCIGVMCYKTLVSMEAQLRQKHCINREWKRLQ